MIKKFLTVLVLGLAVFAVSCSSDVSKDDLSDWGTASAASFVGTTETAAKSAVKAAVNAAMTSEIAEHVEEVDNDDITLDKDTFTAPTAGEVNTYTATVALTAKETDGKTSKLAADTITVKLTQGTAIVSADIVSEITIANATTIISGSSVGVISDAALLITGSSASAFVASWSVDESTQYDDTSKLSDLATAIQKYLSENTGTISPVPAGLDIAETTVVLASTETDSLFKSTSAISPKFDLTLVAEENYFFDNNASTVTMVLTVAAAAAADD